MTTARGAMLAAGVTLALGTLYFELVLRWSASPGLYPESEVEALVLISFLARAAAFVVVPRIRRMELAGVVVLFGVDAFVMIGAAAALAVTGYDPIREFGRAYVLAWMGASVLVYPGPAVVKLASGVAGGGRLASIIPSAAILYVSLILSASVVGVGSESGGLAGVAESFLVGVRGGSAQLFWTPSAAVCGGLLFASLLLKGVAGESGGGRGWPRLSLVMLGMLGAMGSVLAFGQALGPWVVFGVPVGAVALGALVLSKIG